MSNVFEKSSAKPTAAILSIAGSDNTAGAGIQADVKTGAAFGVYVATAITAITVQGSGNAKVYPVPAVQLREQISSAMDTLPVAAIKIGMLANAELLQLVAEFLETLSIPVVLDPVVQASAGGALFAGPQSRDLYIERLLPNITLLTPNLSEAAWLLDQAIADGEDDMLRQGHALTALAGGAVLLKGGHSELRLATDYLFVDNQILPFSSTWLTKLHTHGGGCTLATAIAAGLAQGLSLAQAVAAAKSFIQGAIQHAQRLQLRAQGGPVHQFYQYW